jgi:hypothetical protein
MTGARALIKFNGQLVGMFSSCSWNYSLEVVPAFILGNHTAVALTNTGANAVAIECEGFRQVTDENDQNYYGPHRTVGTRRLVPRLQDLLNDPGTFDITIEDRRTGKTVMKATTCKATGYRTALGARGQQTISVSFIGLRLGDESNPSPNDPGAPLINS